MTPPHIHACGMGIAISSVMCVHTRDFVPIVNGKQSAENVKHKLCASIVASIQVLGRGFCASIAILQSTELPKSNSTQFAAHIIPTCNSIWRSSCRGVRFEAEDFPLRNCCNFLSICQNALCCVCRPFAKHKSLSLSLVMRLATIWLPNSVLFIVGFCFGR